VKCSAAASENSQMFPSQRALHAPFTIHLSQRKHAPLIARVCNHFCAISDMYNNTLATRPPKKIASRHFLV